MALKDSQIQAFFDRKKNKLHLDLDFEQDLTEVKLEPKWSQSGVKLEPKWSQSGVKLEPQLEPTNILTEVKLEPKWSQSGAKLEPQLEPTNILTEVKLEPKWSQNVTIIDTDITFSQLVGLQKKVILCIYENCRLSRKNESQQLTVDFINSCCKTTTCSIKKAIQRLIKKGALIRKSFKDGRSGWTTYELPNHIYYAIIHTESGAKVEPKWSQTKVKVEPQPESQLEPSSPSSSSEYLLKETTTGDNQIPTDWKSIDVEPLAELGFTVNYLTQLIPQNNLSSKIVQDSIYAFAFDIKENGKLKTIKGDPISFFMGILKRSGGYVPPSNYESPQQRHMRLYEERMTELETKNAEIEKKALELAFNEWFLKLTDEQKKEFLPKSWSSKSGISLDKNKMLLSCAKSHFEKELWAAKRSEIVSSLDGA